MASSPVRPEAACLNEVALAEVVSTGCGPEAEAPQAADANTGSDHDSFVAVSLHLKSADKATLEKAFASINASIRDKVSTRECAAYLNSSVMLQDGVYVPWKKPSTKKRMRACCKNYFGDLVCEIVFHSKSWEWAGPGMTYVDAARVSCVADAARALRAEGLGPPPRREQKRAAQPSSSSAVEVVDGQPARHTVTTIAAKPRPMMSLDLVGFQDGAAADLVLRSRGAQLYDAVVAKLGRGTFGEVYSGNTVDGPVAIKKMRLLEGQSARAHCDAALAEVSILERCADHPHIVTLLDVARTGQRMVLVFELWGSDLESKYARHPELFSPDRLRTIAAHVAMGLGHLHGLCLVHTDIKPDNVLAVFDSDCVLSSPSERVHVKLADLGSCVVADPARRPDVRVEHATGNSICKALRTRGLQITTLPYRAPEVVFGDECFGTAVDVWALGSVMLRLTGCSDFCHADSEVGLRESWFRQLGTPIGDDLACLSAFQWYPTLTPQLAARPFPREVSALLGRDGCAFVRSLLSWRAQSRPNSAEMLAAAFFQPTRFELVAPDPGERYADPRTSVFLRRAPQLELRHWVCCARDFERHVSGRCVSCR